MDERSPLLNTSVSINDGVIPKYISDPKKKGKQWFKWAIPSQETESAHKDRFLSIKICYLAMFLTSVSFTITISSMWPFLLIIDETISASFFGWIVSFYSVGQLLSSPLFGYWANRIRCHKIPIIVTLFIMVLGNVIYFYLESMEKIDWLAPKYWMLIARFIMGFGAASAAVVRSYVSSATNMAERTACLANISACQGIGFIIGPVLQAALVPIGYPGPIINAAFKFNMYTSPAILSILIYVILAIVIYVYFNEYVVLDNETQDLSKILQGGVGNINSLSESIKNLPPPDYTAIVLTLFLFFLNCSVFSFIETLSSPFTIDMYAWSKSEATFYNGIIFGALGLFSVIVVLISKVLAKRFKEKDLMLAGYVFLFLSVIGLLPWGNEYPAIEIQPIGPGLRNTTFAYNITTTTEFMNSTTPAIVEPRGCPANYDWCYNTPIIKFYQFIIGFAVLVCAYSVANVMSFAIYSKLLGPKPQGTMMGILTSVGSLSRAFGPILISFLYSAYGPRVSFGAIGVVIFFSNIIIVLTYKRYEPYKYSISRSINQNLNA